MKSDYNWVDNNQELDWSNIPTFTDKYQVNYIPTNDNEWTMDSGATKHFTNNKNNLINIININITVSTAKNGVKLKAIKMGDIKLSHSITLKNVL